MDFYFFDHFFLKKFSKNSINKVKQSWEIKRASKSFNPNIGTRNNDDKKIEEATMNNLKKNSFLFFDNIFNNFKCFIH